MRAAPAASFTISAGWWCGVIVCSLMCWAMAVCFVLAAAGAF